MADHGTGDIGGAILFVVAAALVDADGLVLVQQRPPGTAHAGLWEFPGGKCNPGEPPREALVRELAEELGIAVQPDLLSPLSFYCGPRDAGGGTDDLVMLLFIARRWAGTPQACDNQLLRWVSPPGLAALPMPPADVPLRAVLTAHLAVI